MVDEFLETFVSETKLAKLKLAKADAFEVHDHVGVMTLMHADGLLANSRMRATDASWTRFSRGTEAAEHIGSMKHDDSEVLFQGVEIERAEWSQRVVMTQTFLVDKLANFKDQFLPYEYMLAEQQLRPQEHPVGDQTVDPYDQGTSKEKMM